MKEIKQGSQDVSQMRKGLILYYMMTRNGGASICVRYLR